MEKPASQPASRVRGLPFSEGNLARLAKPAAAAAAAQAEGKIWLASFLAAVAASH